MRWKLVIAGSMTDDTWVEESLHATFATADHIGRAVTYYWRGVASIRYFVIDTEGIY